MNLQKDLDKLISQLDHTPTLLLHSCCAPCSSYVLEYLSDFFAITVYYYNPNIYPAEEYQKRVNEQKRLISELETKNPVKFIEGSYEPEKYFEEVKGLENEPEGGARCEKCFRMRIFDAARLAAENGFEYFTTTMSISPHKNAEVLNRVGLEAEEEYNVKLLPSDFKKKGGYLRSIQLSVLHSLYRQNFCGCIFSHDKDKK